MSNDARAWSLEAGIDARQWPEAARIATTKLRQGLLVADPPFLYAASADNPIHHVTRIWAQSPKATSGAVVVTRTHDRPPYGIIATQTCDVVEEGKPKRPWIQLCPVYELEVDKGKRKMIVTGRGFRYLSAVTALPARGDRIWVADLRLLIPVEKGWLVGRDTQPAFNEETEFDRFADQLAARFARPAFAAVVGTHVLSPTHELLNQIANAFDGHDPIVEVGLALGRNRLDPTNVQVVFIHDGALGDDLRAMIMDWWALTADAARNAGLEMLPPRFEAIDEISARDYRALDPLPPED